MAGEQVTARLRGQTAHLGSVQARDLARLLLDLEGALAASAYVALGKPRRGSTGRHVAAVEAATRLHLRAIESGSVVAVLGLPVLAADDPDALDLGVDDLAGAAFDELIAAFHSDDRNVDPTIARALADLADDVGIGDRNTEVIISGERERTPEAVVLNAAGRVRFRRLASAAPEPTRQPDMLVGTLREADLDRHTARLHTPNGETVQVSFPPELEAEVHEAMRGLSNFEGVVTYDPKTSLAKSVVLRRITLPATALFGDDFFSTPLNVAQLAAEQGVGVADFDGPLIELTAEERAELLDALRELDA